MLEKRKTKQYKGQRPPWIKNLDFFETKKTRIAILILVKLPKHITINTLLNITKLTHQMNRCISQNNPSSRGIFNCILRFSSFTGYSSNTS